MFSLFRINDPFRLIGVVLILILFRIPYYLEGMPQFAGEIEWMLIGEKMAQGSSMYVDIWDNEGPLSAFVFYLFDLVFGRSQLALHIAAIILILFQSFHINNTFLKLRAFQENTYSLAFIYALLSCLFYDCFSLSPLLISLTWLLFTIRNLCNYFESKNQTQLLLFAGINLGIAILFYFPTWLLVIPLLFSLIFFSGFDLRKYFLFLYAFTLPISIVTLYYYWIEGSSLFMSNWVVANFVIPVEFLFSLESFAVVMGPLLVLFIIASLRLFSIRFNNSQTRVIQVMYLLFVGSALSLFFVDFISYHHFLLALPMLAFVITHFFLSFKSSARLELIFTFFVFCFMISKTETQVKIPYLTDWVQSNDTHLKETIWDEEVKGKKVLSLEPRFDVYKASSHASPFFNWRQYSYLINEDNYYNNVIDFYSLIKDDMPEIIVDPQEELSGLFSRIPQLNQSYEWDSKLNIYRLRH